MKLESGPGAVAQISIVRRCLSRPFELSALSTSVLVGLYGDCLVLFEVPRGSTIPPAFYRESPKERTSPPPPIKSMRRVPLEMIERVDAKGISGGLEITVLFEQGQMQFRLGTQEALHFLKGLRGLLGDRVSELSTRQIYSQKGAPKVGMVVASIILIGSTFSLFLLAHAPHKESFMMLGLFVASGWSTNLSICYLMGVFVDHVLEGRVQSPDGRKPFRSRKIGLACRMAGLIPFLVGYFFPDELASCFLDLVNASGDLAGLRRVLSSNIQVILILLGISLAYTGYRIGQHEFRSGATGDLLLFLRAFADDGRYSLNADTLAVRILGLRPFKYLQRFKLGPLANTNPIRVLRLVLGVGMDTIEEQLAGPLRKVGTFVAIGKPGERLATGGAMRTYVPDDAWQDEVRSLVSRSRFVIVQPARTESVTWEIREVVQRIDPTRLILSVAHLAPVNALNPYLHFRKRFEEITGKSLPARLDGAVFIRFDGDWKPILTHPVFHPAFLWPVTGMTINIKKTLGSIFEDSEKSASGERPFQARAPGKLGILAAIALWVAIPMAGLMIVEDIRGFHRNHNAMVNGPYAEHRGASGTLGWNLGPSWRVDWGAECELSAQCRENDVPVASIDVFREPQQDGRNLDWYTDEQVGLITSVCVSTPHAVRRFNRTIGGIEWQIIELQCLVDNAFDLQMETYMGFTSSLERRMERAARRRVLVACCVVSGYRYAVWFDTYEHWLRDLWKSEQSRLEQVFEGIRIQ